MFEVLTSYDQVLEIPTRDLLCWLGDKVWRETAWENRPYRTPLIFFEPAANRLDSTFLLIEKSGAVHEAASIEMALRQAVWEELNRGKVFLKPWVPKQSRKYLAQRDNRSTREAKVNFALTGAVRSCES